eukprot:3344963-Prorocentrum_lima.AAC.1
MTSSLVGSEMCIRDRSSLGSDGWGQHTELQEPPKHGSCGGLTRTQQEAVSYTHLTLPTICSV